MVSTASMSHWTGPHSKESHWSKTTRSRVLSEPYLFPRTVGKVFPPERVGKHRQKHWRAKAIEYTHVQGSIRGFPAMIDGEDDEDQFLFEGESDADINVRVEIQGAWLHDLPWQRLASTEA